jgi:DNA polymerase-4
MIEHLESIATVLERRLKKHNISGKTVTLKIKYSDFHSIREVRHFYFISDRGLIFEVVRDLLYQERMKNSVRLLGISLSNLNTEVKKAVVTNCDLILIN